MKSIKHIAKVAGILAIGAGFGGSAFAQSISPSSVNQTIAVGDSFTIHKTVTLAASGATNVDIFFLADNTGSMGGTVGSAQSGANAILGGLSNSYRFGVGHYYGDPIESCGSTECGYSQITALTTNKADVQAGINTWNASSGGDGPEANFYALQQVANGAGWNASSQRLVVWFGDYPSHNETTTMTQAIDALKANGVKVIAFNDYGPAGGDIGIDGSYNGDNNQASTIVAAVGGSLTNDFGSVSAADFVTAVSSQISTATSTLDLSFGSTFAGTGLEISFLCTDAKGCSNVTGGESRTFDVTIKGMTPGVYEFDVFAKGVGPTEHDVITVTAVPEPETYAMMLAGLGLLGAIKRRRVLRKS